MAEHHRRKKRGHHLLSTPQFGLVHVYAGGWYAPGLGYDWTAQKTGKEQDEQTDTSQGTTGDGGDAGAGGGTSG